MEKPGHAIAFLPGKHEGTVIPLEAEKDDLQLSTSVTRRRKVQPELGGLLLYWFRWSHGYLYLRDWHLATLWKERDGSESLCMPLATALTGESLTKSPTLPAGPQRIYTFYTQLSSSSGCLQMYRAAFPNNAQGVYSAKLVTVLLLSFRCTSEMNFPVFLRRTDSRFDIG